MLSQSELSLLGFIKSELEGYNFYIPEEKLNADNYSDGSESDILQILQNSRDVSVMSEELKLATTNWPRLYHLGRQRANLLAPLHSILAGNILEVGAGCGGLTRALGETALQITSIEPSAARARVAAERVRDLSNVTVINCSLSQLNTPNRFNVIVLVGVLEYSRVNFGGGLIGSTVEDALENVRTKLCPGGQLVLAIENQLGLKYICGYAEDHVGKPMHGIEDLYTSESVVTFGKIELTSLLNRAGLIYQDWWYPWPDYKLPVFLLSDRGAKKYGREFSPLLADVALEDPQRPVGRNFSMQRSLPVFARNELSGELANSFLVVASQEKMSLDHTISIYINNRLLPKFAKRVEFREIEPGVIKVFRSNIYDNNSFTNCNISQYLTPVEDFVHGERWSDRLITLVSKQNWSLGEIFNWADEWWNAVICAGGLILNRNQIYVDKSFLDAIPRNLIRKENKSWIFFDLEWIYRDQFPADLLIFRAMLASFSQIQKFEIPADGRIKLLDLISFILERYGFPSSPARLEELYTMELEIYENVYGLSNESIKFSDLEMIILDQGYRR